MISFALSSNWCLVGLTFALLIVSTIQAGVYWHQAGIMKEAIEQNRESSERSLRAYIAVVNDDHAALDMVSKTQKHFPYEFDVLARNSGQTPAYNVTSYSTWLYLSKPNSEVPADFKFDAATAPKITQSNEYRGSKTTLGSGQIVRKVIKFGDIGPAKFQDALDKLIKNEATIFIFGVIIYDDIFQKQHSTEYCFRMLHLENKTFTHSNYHRNNDAT